MPSTLFWRDDEAHMGELAMFAQGAEAKLYLLGNTVVKHRFKKEYRHPAIDKILTRRRTRAEKRILQRLSDSGLNVPKILEGDVLPSESTIYMEKIEGQALRDMDIKQEVFLELGILVRSIHDLNVVHGDLTTSNFLLSQGKLFAIDFGLAFFSEKDEDKAVDLYVLERAIKCVHDENMIRAFYEGYGTGKVMVKLQEVRRRGRKREENAFG